MWPLECRDVPTLPAQALSIVVSAKNAGGSVPRPPDGPPPHLLALLPHSHPCSLPAAAGAWLGSFPLSSLSRDGRASGPRRVPSLKTTQGSLPKHFPFSTEVTETLAQTCQ